MAQRPKPPPTTKTRARPPNAQVARLPLPYPTIHHDRCTHTLARGCTRGWVGVVLLTSLLTELLDRDRQIGRNTAVAGSCSHWTPADTLQRTTDQMRCRDLLHPGQAHGS